MRGGTHDGERRLYLCSVTKDLRCKNRFHSLFSYRNLNMLLHVSQYAGHPIRTSIPYSSHIFYLAQTYPGEGKMWLIGTVSLQMRSSHSVSQCTMAYVSLLTTFEETPPFFRSRSCSRCKDLSFFFFFLPPFWVRVKVGQEG